VALSKPNEINCLFKNRAFLIRGGVFNKRVSEALMNGGGRDRSGSAWDISFKVSG
jgi:hypothetical protein